MDNLRDLRRREPLRNAEGRAGQSVFPKGQRCGDGHGTAHIPVIAFAQAAGEPHDRGNGGWGRSGWCATMNAEDRALPRTHEDRERHTLVDHRAGGPPAAFATGSWLAIGIARVKAERNDACVSAYETLVEKARTSNVHAGSAAVLASDNERRVVVLVGVRGHDGFRHLAAAWDDHHRNAQHRVIAESVSFALYEVAAAIGAVEIDPSSHDAYVYEHVERPVERVADLLSSLGATPEFRGALIFGGDTTTGTVVLSRFEHSAAYTTFRSGRDAINALGSLSGSGETSFGVHPRKTFAVY